MRYIYLFLVLGILVLSGCSTEVVEEDVPILEPDDPDEEVVEGDTVEIDMVAKQFEFDPEVIEVNKGDTVILHITSVDVAHGISIPEYGVDEFLGVDEEVTIEFVADKEGEFNFICNVFCGSGHGAMKGTLIVN
tara:strand:+ start:935 stop:1336 length:402 start_codon:yes stop_codon:yes gene_type:complete